MDRRPRRFGQLIGGLLLYGAAIGLMVRAVLGLDPWDVFHQGLTGWVSRWVVVGAVFGGMLGVGTVICALGIEPLLHLLLPRLTVGSGRAGTVALAAK